MSCLLVFLLTAITSLLSPDGRLKVGIVFGENRVEYTLSCDDKVLVAPSEISMTLSDGNFFPSGEVRSVRRKSINRSIPAPLYRKGHIQDVYNELTLVYNGCCVVFRLFDNAFAWRFEAKKRSPYKVIAEQTSFNFSEDWKAYAAYTHKYPESGLESQFCDDFENMYAHVRLSELDGGHLITTPLMVEGPDDIKMVITESDLVSYPGMFLYNEKGDCSLVGKNARVPDKVEIGGHNNLQEMVVSRHDYIAQCDGSKRNFPWRVICVSHEDRQMADNDAVYCLAFDCKNPRQYSWVKPGKVAWDWWNAWNLQGVNFTPGINTQTYKYFVDFAAAYNLEYIMLDEGWSQYGKNDLFKVIPELNLEEIIQYADSKGVGVFLWAGYYPFKKDMEAVCKHYSSMGVKGFKVDFFDRDDQTVEDFMMDAAKTCAKYKLMLNFHGTHKPTGIQRRYPNIINQEGIFGLEQMRKREYPQYDMVTFDVQIPYIRYVAGFADYTPGAMRNFTSETFRPSKLEPGSQGTRARELAKYIVFDAPLNMLCDSPTAYEAEPECMYFLSAVPTVWDETRVLEGKVGEYIVTARRKGNTWYIGAMTNWKERDIIINLTELCGNNARAIVWQDGPDAEKNAADFRKVEMDAIATLAVHLSAGGGFAAILN